MAENDPTRPIELTHKVFDWRKRRSWLASVRHYASHVLTAELRRYLERERPSCWSDDLSWLPDADYILPEFLASLTDYYSHLKGFHGCRPLNLSRYYERGLLGQNSDVLCDIFREFFSDVPKGEVEKAIRQFVDRSTSERGKIWLLGSDKFLVEECGHYLIQGSEYLMALAAQLTSSSNSEDYRFRLRNYGIPTILEVDIPLKLVPGAQHVALAKMILSEWGQLAARRPLSFGNEPPCYIVSHNIPPECLRDHYHPELIMDPHKGRRHYVNHLLTCDMCC